MTQYMFVNTGAKCALCLQSIDDYGLSGGEVWHETCWQKHRTADPRCKHHSLCKRETLKREWAAKHKETNN